MSVNPETLTDTVKRLQAIHQAAKDTAAQVAAEREKASNPLPTAPLFPVPSEGEK